MTKASTASITLALLLVGCPPPVVVDPDAGPPWFEDDWEATYADVRSCRSSPEHDLSYIRVFANDIAEETYTTREGEFAEGAVLVKPEYADPDCSILIGIKAMRYTGGGWEFQRYDEDGHVMAGDTLRCVGCHLSTCGFPPDGYMGTCAAEP